MEWDVFTCDFLGPQIQIETSLTSFGYEAVLIDHLHSLLLSSYLDTIWQKNNAVSHV